WATPRWSRCSLIATPAWPPPMTTTSVVSAAVFDMDTLPSLPRCCGMCFVADGHNFNVALTPSSKPPVEVALPIVLLGPPHLMNRCRFVRRSLRGIAQTVFGQLEPLPRSELFGTLEVPSFCPTREPPRQGSRGRYPSRPQTSPSARNEPGSTRPHAESARGRRSQGSSSAPPCRSAGSAVFG